MNRFASSSAVALCAVALCPVNAAKAVEIRTCGSEVRTAPLNDERSVQSLLLQSFAIVNDSAAPIDLDEVTLELLDKGALRDVRMLDSSDIGRAVASAPQVNAIAQILPRWHPTRRLFSRISFLSGAAPAIFCGSAQVIIAPPLRFPTHRQKPRRCFP
jgi:hypothetical protein